MATINATGVETLVNVSTLENQALNSVTTLTGGRYVVVWTDYLLNGALNATTAANADVKMRLYNEDGTPATGEIIVNSVITGPQVLPTVTALTDGNFIVAWMDGLGTVIGGPGTPAASIKAREFDANGVGVGAEFQIGSAGTEYMLPSLTGLAGGGFAAALHQGGLGGAIIGQIYDGSNATVGGQFTISATSVGIGTAALDTLANGNFVAAWSSTTPGSGVAKAQVFSPAGASVGAGITTGFGYNSGIMTSVVAVASGGFAIGYSGTLTGVYTSNGFSGHLADGTLALNQTVSSVAPTTPFSSMGVTLTALTNGGLTAMWTDSSPGDGNGSGIRMNSYNPVGDQFGSTLLVNTTTSGAQSVPRATLLNNGDLVTFWADASGLGGDASGISIKSQRFDVDYTNQLPVAVNDDLVDQGGTTIFAANDLLDNDSDADADALIISAISNVQGGTVTLNVQTQEITVIRPVGYSGTISFTYTVDDPFGGSDTAVATVNPSRDDAYTLRGITPTTLNILANDNLAPRADGYVVTTTQPGYGSATVTGSNEASALSYQSIGGNLAYLYLPVGQTLQSFLTYTVTNPVSGQPDYTAQVSITLEGWTTTGGTGYDEMFGTALPDHLVGGTGAANFMAGGAGDDVYTAQAVGDSVYELADQGYDFVLTPLSVFVLPNNVEGLFYQGGTAFLGVGNSHDNRITGGVARDDLFGDEGNDNLAGGGGGTGNENTLIGGTGDDLYIVGVRGDSTIEYAGEGTDEVQTTFSIFALQNNVENLTFTDTAFHEGGVGNDLDNVIKGNIGRDDLYGRAGNDTLHGGTGAANTLLGQEGDDLYIVSVVGDSVIEVGGQGNDTVQTSAAAFTLPANVETLVYTGTASFLGVGGMDANSITGGAQNDFLSGMEGADTLTGGSGADELLGGAGADIFRYVGGETGMDRIYDFAPGSDRISLSSAFFTPTGTVDLVQGAAPVATSANSSFLYDSATGILSYDDDGNGAGAAVALAQLNFGLVLSASDLIFV